MIVSRIVEPPVPANSTKLMSGTSLIKTDTLVLAHGTDDATHILQKFCTFFV